MPALRGTQGRRRDDSSQSGRIALSDEMCLREGYGRRKPNEEVEPFSSEAAEILGLSLKDSEDVMKEFRADYEAEREMFS